MMNPERLELCDTLVALRKALDDLVVRGLRNSGPQDLAALSSMQTDFARVGAHHLSQRLITLLEQVRSDHPKAPEALLGLQASLVVFERVLSLDSVYPALAGLDGDLPEDDDDEDEDEDDA